MTVAEKLRFLADRIEDEKEFSIGSEYDWYRFRNSKLKYVGQDRTDEYSPMSLNYILTSPLKLKPMWEFTEEEKTMLRNVDDKWKWIARDENGSSFLYANKPYKLENYWADSINMYAMFNIYKHLFQSIQWSDEEPCEFRRYL